GSWVCSRKPQNQQKQTTIKAIAYNLEIIGRTIKVWIFINPNTFLQSQGGDRLIIAVSALLHDIHRIIQKETGKYCTPKDSLPKVKQILDKTELTQTQKEKILHCIEFHEEYNFSKNVKIVTDIETLVLQDADNIDAIGAIGIGRCLYYCASYNIPMWIPEIPLETENYDSTKHDPTVIHHFYHKLLNIKDGMNTKTGKEIASKRHEFMELFLKEFFDEWNGKK
ncbi:MAG: hypothetical protein Q7S21_04845, partial [archaeon]|nr:hypothetical protein [archaeon]